MVTADRVRNRLRPHDAAARAFPPIEAELGGYASLLRGRVLNAGAGDRDLSHLVDGNLVNQDIPQGGHPGDIQIWAPLEAIPVADGHFDAAICNAVLEHVVDPEQVMRELARVLRVGGTLYLGVPFMQPEHRDPRDGQRWTAQGLASLCERHGFEVREVTVVHSVETTLAWIVYEWLQAERRIPMLIAGRALYEWLVRTAVRSRRKVPALASAHRAVCVRV